MSRDSARELPILTDVVELHATGSFPKPERCAGARIALRVGPAVRGGRRRTAGPAGEPNAEPHR